MLNEIKEYLDSLFRLDNPIYFSVFLAITLFVLIFIFYKYILLPVQKKYYMEKRELELKNVKLMALFAELDPNPLIRINAKGKIIHTNDAAKKLDGSVSIEGKDIHEILPQINFPIKESIKEEKSISFTETINNKYYSILFRGIPYLEIAQIYFSDLTERKQYEEELRISRARLKELSKHLQNTLEEERQRIARELHDGVGQNLLLFRLKLRQLEQLVSDRIDKKEYDLLIESVENSIQELKTISHVLKPKILEELGLVPALSFLCNRISRESNIYGSIDVSGREERLNGKSEVMLYRLTQEALNNIVKHSRAKIFNVQLMYGYESIKLIISDDGIGFEPDDLRTQESLAGMGLINMQERIEEFKGKLKIDSAPGNGTVVIVEIPSITVAQL
jgi:signal transduction histidine kinase